MGRVRKRHGLYFIDYRDHGRRKRETVGPNREEAERILKKRMGESVRADHSDIFESKVKFEDFAKSYEIYSNSFKKSWARNGKHALNRLVEFFRGKLLSEITPALVERYQTMRKENPLVLKARLKIRSGATINRELSLLRAMFNKAIRDKLLTVNPVRGLKFYSEKQNARTRYLSKEEIEKLLSTCRDIRLRSAVILALNTGLRKGELTTLKWEDVFFEQGLIRLTQTKNGEIRFIHLNEDAKKAVSSVPKHPQSPFIFCNKDGNPYNLRKSFETALKNTGIKDFRWHDLRHTFASHLVMAGVDLNTVRELLGHKSMAMTIRYSHLSQAHKAKAVEILSKRLGVGTRWAQEQKSEDHEKFDELVNSLNKDS